MYHSKGVIGKEDIILGVDMLYNDKGVRDNITHAFAQKYDGYPHVKVYNTTRNIIEARPLKTIGGPHVHRDS